MLLDELEKVGGHEALDMRQFVHVNWFKSLAMYPRQIEEFHVKCLSAVQQADTSTTFETENSSFRPGFDGS